jgi:NTP pyrophosphatase (non-canonical NTP hydrolase)
MKGLSEMEPVHFLQALRAANYNRNEEWANKERPFSLIFWANELAGEVGEACNILKKLDREFNYNVRGSRATLPALSEELADIIICADLLGMAAQINYRDDLCWPKPGSMAGRDYSTLGAMLARDVGRACGVVLLRDHTSILQSVLHELIFDTKTVAGKLGIDLEHWTRTKFNMTSEKMGLKTKLP